MTLTKRMATRVTAMVAPGPMATESGVFLTEPVAEVGASVAVPTQVQRAAYHSTEPVVSTSKPMSNRVGGQQS